MSNYDHQTPSNQRRGDNDIKSLASDKWPSLIMIPKLSNVDVLNPQNHGSNLELDKLGKESWS